MADELETILRELPLAEPVWIQSGAATAEADPSWAAQLLAGMDAEDRNLCVLVYGLGLNFGSVSYALRLDPAVTTWRLDQLLTESASAPAERARLETSLTSLLRHPQGTLPAPPEGAASWLARDLVLALPQSIRSRLQARLSRDEHDLLQRRSRSGLGVGVLFLVGAVFLFFLVYGAVLDQNPMWRGREMVRRGQYDKARDSFAMLGVLPEARRWTAIAWLSEGEYAQALQVIRRPDTGWPANFQAVAAPLPDVEVDPTSLALLPRGLEMNPRPEFVFVAGESGLLELYSEGTQRSLRAELGELGPLGETVLLDYPEDWPSLPSGVMKWSVPGPPGEPRQSATFELLPPNERTSINNELSSNLQELPPAARLYMRGHYFLRYGLYVRAAHQFASLARQFPGQSHPRNMLDEIGQALGVDPEIFLR